MISSELAGYDIDTNSLQEVERNLTIATRDLFGRYEVKIASESEAIEAIQSAAADWVLDFAEKLDRSIAEQFEVLAGDLEDPYSTDARSTTYFMLGRAHMSSNLIALDTLSEEIIAHEYESGHSKH